MLSRRAGGAFLLHAKDKAALERFRSFWSLVIAQFAPGLEYEDALVEGEDPIAAAAQARGDETKARFAATPPLPSCREPVHSSAAASARACPPLLSCTRRRWTASPCASRQFNRTQSLARRFASDDEKTRIWPTHFDPEDGKADRGRLFPFEGDRRIVGIVHADGNGMGEMLRRLNPYLAGRPADEAVRKALAFSMAIEQATTGAAQAATAEILDERRASDGRMPARPILLGGDDLTAIIRGDLAVPFAKLFLEEFERRSAAYMRDVFGDAPDVPGGMSACAGIAFVKATQPFYLAHGLAGELCKAAKGGSRADANGRFPVPSSLAFHRVTTSFVDSYETIRREELTIQDAAREIVLSCQPYAVGAVASSLSPLSALLELRDRLHASGGRGGLRQAWSLVFRSRVRRQARRRAAISSPWLRASATG